MFIALRQISRRLQRSSATPSSRLKHQKSINLIDVPKVQVRSRARLYNYHNAASIIELNQSHYITITNNYQKQ